MSIDGFELKSFDRWKQLEATLESEPLREFEFVIERDGKNIEITSKAQDLSGADNYSEKEYPRGFSNQPILNRLAIVVAGPFMNFLLPLTFRIIWKGIILVLQGIYLSRKRWLI